VEFKFSFQAKHDTLTAYFTQKEQVWYTELVNYVLPDKSKENRG